MMRCLALAQACHDAGAQATFLTAYDIPNLASKIREEGFQIEQLNAKPGTPDDMHQTTETAHAFGALWVVVDGYVFGADYQRAIKDAGLRLLFIDDYGHADHYCADLVLNQNVYATEDLYPNHESYTQFLLGTDYVLLRREFLEWRDCRREIPEQARKILVTLGGSDPDNVTLKVIKGIEQLDSDNLSVCVIVGATNPHLDTLRQVCSQASKQIEIQSNITDIPDRMAWADIAISAGGSTCWEMAFMGLPNAIVVLADNQRPIAEHLDKRGVSINLGWHESVLTDSIKKTLSSILDSRQERIDMVEKGRNLVDGEGAERVRMMLEDKKLRLRLVRNDDCRLLWEWVNDPLVRSLAYSTNQISWENHKKWFDEKIADSDCHIWIAVDNEDRPVGQIRFDACGHGEAEIDVSIDQKFRRSGYGSMIIDMGSQAMFTRTGTRLLHAYIRPENEASIHAFEKARFVNRGRKTISGVKSYYYVREKSDE